MRILLQPPRPDAPSFEVDFEIQKALVALHGYSIKIRGAGRFGDGAAAIVLQRETDADEGAGRAQGCRHPRLDDVAVAEVRPPT